MADFFSRIFAIPSDGSSTYSPDELRHQEIIGTANPNGGKKKKKGHSRTLTPLSLADGNYTMASSLLSHGDNGSELESSVDRGGSTTQHSTTSNSSETMEEHLHHIDCYDEDNNSQDHRRGSGSGRQRNHHALSPTATATSSPRGRQRRNDNSVHRSASEPRHSPTKAHRSSSMASSSHTKRSNQLTVSTGSGGGTTASRNMTLQLNSPTKNHNRRQHRSVSKMGGGSRGTAAASSPSSNKDGTLTRINSWSSGEEKEGRKQEHFNEGTRRSRSSSTKPASTTHASKKSTRSRSSSQQQARRMDSNTTGNTNNSSSTATTKTKEKSKKSDKSWRSKLTGGMKKLSPGGPGIGTPPLQKHKSSKRGGGSKKSKKEFTNSPTMVNPKKQGSHRPPGEASAGRKKLNLPPGQNQPIDIGDSIVISQQFLEESMDMSVLTMPRELVAMNEKNEPAAGIMERFDKEIQEVGQGRVMENDQVQAFLDRRANIRRGDAVIDTIPSSSTGVSTTLGRDRVPMNEKIGAYASRILEEGGIYQSYSQDQLMDHNEEEEGIEVRPAQRLGLTRDVGKTLAHVAGADGGKQSWPCDPSADRYKNGGIPPPPPPPLPRHGKSPNNTSLVQSSLHPNSAAGAAVPHWNTPANSSNTVSIATSYDDPPGTLVTSPTLQMQSSSGTLDTISTKRQLHHDIPNGQHQQRSKSDPPGDDLYTRPFDESSSGLGNRGHSPGIAIAGQNKLKSSGSGKAVTFSLPPPQSASQQQPPPAPPFMGPPLDYYYSMERNPNAKEPPLFSNPLLLPPIIELLSSVEGSDNVVSSVGDDVNVIGSALRWDTRREEKLVGEDLPLHVSEGWLDVCDKEENEEVKEEEMATDDTDSVHDQTRSMVTEKLNTSTAAVEAADAAAACNVGVSSQEGVSSSSRHSVPADDDIPHDEYFDDILNCGEDFRNNNSNIMGDSANDHYFEDDVSSRQNSQDVTATHPVDNIEEDVNFRYRSTWGTSYKPPKLSLEEDESILQHRSRHNENWQRLVRHRANATIAIQKSVRGFLERQRLRLLIDAVLIIQPCMQSYLERKRYLEYLKVKRSYYPKRWARSNMAVDV